MANESSPIGICGHHPSICARLQQERETANANPEVYFVGYLYLAFSLVALLPALLILAILLRPHFLKQPFYQLLVFFFTLVAANVLLTGVRNVVIGSDKEIKRL
uniref:G_PROTEIN_RECEP_F1_2 domain-containing protein n=1 Tax=Steinernema glaseri TaxID=37863 RepID=A0A1I7ZZ22_9BILA